MSKIRHASGEDYPDILRYLAEAYGVSGDFFPRTYPSWWRREHVSFEKIWLMEKQGEILSLVRIFPLKLQLGEISLRAAGVGAVSTAPEARGQGFMQRLMCHAVDEMKREEFPLSVLWGDRHRYRLFGYESAGNNIVVRVTARGLAKAGIAPIAPTVFHGEPELLQEIARAYRAHPFHRVRGDHEEELLYQRAGLVTWCGRCEGHFGYLCLLGERSDRAVAEYGGHPHVVLRLAARAFAAHQPPALFFSFPSRDFLPPEFRAAASSWSVEAACMLKILHLAPLLDLFRPYLTDDPAAAQPALLALPEPEAVDALFGVGKPGAAPFFCWPLDRV